MLAADLDDVALVDMVSWLLVMLWPGASSWGRALIESATGAAAPGGGGGGGEGMGGGGGTKAGSASSWWRLSRRR